MKRRLLHGVGSIEPTLLLLSLLCLSVLAPLRGGGKSEEATKRTEQEKLEKQKKEEEQRKEKQKETQREEQVRQLAEARHREETRRTEQRKIAGGRQEEAGKWDQLSEVDRAAMIKTKLASLKDRTLPIREYLGLAPELVKEMFRQDPEALMTRLNSLSPAERQNFSGILPESYVRDIIEVLREKFGVPKAVAGVVPPVQPITGDVLDRFTKIADSLDAFIPRDRLPNRKNELRQVVFDANARYISTRYEHLMHPEVGPGLVDYVGTGDVMRRALELRERAERMDREEPGLTMTVEVVGPFINYILINRAALERLADEYFDAAEAAGPEKLTDAFLFSSNLAALPTVSLVPSNKAFDSRDVNFLRSITKDYFGRLQQLDTNNFSQFITFTQQRSMGRSGTGRPEPNFIDSLRTMFSISMADPETKKTAFDATVDFLARVSTHATDTEVADIQAAIIPLFSESVLDSADPESLSKLGAVVDLLHREADAIGLAYESLNALKAAVDKRRPSPSLLEFLSKLLRKLTSWKLFKDQQVSIDFKNLIDDMRSRGVNIPDDYYDKFYARFFAFQDLLKKQRKQVFEGQQGPAAGTGSVSRAGAAQETGLASPAVAGGSSSAAPSAVAGRGATTSVAPLTTQPGGSSGGRTVRVIS